MFNLKDATGPSPLYLFSSGLATSKAVYMESKGSARGRTRFSPQLLRKMSDSRQNNKKPLQKHTRRSTKLRQSQV